MSVTTRSVEKIESQSTLFDMLIPETRLAHCSGFFRADSLQDDNFLLES